MVTDPFQLLLNALPFQAAVLDWTGVILQVNPRWLEFAEANGGDPARCGCGVNYLQVCRDACQGEDGGLPHTAADGIEAVLRGQETQFSLDYPCDGLGLRRQFRLHATRLAPLAEPARVLVLHQDITFCTTAGAVQAGGHELPQSPEPSAAVRTAHALRSPLTTVLGLTELALFDLRQPLPLEQRTRLQRIQSAGESMVTLLDDLVSTSASGARR